MSIESRLDPAGSRNRSSIVLEIRAAEGGDDAKALVREQLDIYLRVAARREL